jgi:hypothetical protein
MALFLLVCCYLPWQTTMTHFSDRSDYQHSGSDVAAADTLLHLFVGAA